MPPRRSLGIFTILTALAITNPALAQGHASHVRVDAARMEPVEQRREVVGEFEPVKRSRLAAQAEGLVTEIFFDAGDEVERGQVLAQLDETRVRIEVLRYRAELDSANAITSLREAELEKASRDVHRLEQAQAQQGASVNEVDDARTAEKAAQARLAEATADALVAQQNLADAEDRLQDMTIRAPFAGSIITKSTEVGEWIAEGDTVAELIALDSIDAILDVPQQYLPLLTTDSAVTVELHIEAIGMERQTQVLNVISSANTLARTFPVRVRLDNKDHTLRPGMSVVGLIPTGQTVAALTIHKDALLRDDAGTFVYFIVSDTAMPARIRPMYAIADRVVVQSATLQDGSRLVIEGNERLYPSAKVIIASDTPDPARARGE